MNTKSRNLYFSDDTLLGGPDEGNDVPNFVAGRHLILYLVAGIHDVTLSVEHETVGVGDVAQHFVGDAVDAAHGGVDAAIADGCASGDDVGRHVFREGCSGLYHGSLADTGLGVLYDGGGEDDTVADLAVAGNLCAVAEDAAVAHLGVVGDVGTLHQTVVVADDGLAATVGGTVDDNVLANDVVVADDEFRLFSPEVEVLGKCGEHGALMHFVAGTHARAVKDGDEGEDDASVANLHVVFDIDEGEDFTVVADFSTGADFGSWGNIACHNYFIS